MSNPRSKLPALQAISQMMEGLLGKQVTCSEASERYDCKGDVAIGVYTLDPLGGDTADAVVVGDTGFVAFAGAALSLIPAARAEELVASGVIDEERRGDAHEVFNVLSTLFHADDRACRLMNLHFVGSPEPAELQALLEGSSLHVELEIEGYGPGHASFYLVG